MMKLVIAEKPSVALSIAKVIGAVKRQDGYMEGNGYLVSWCFGHLVELCMADGYDEKYKRWNIGDLPIVPAKWKYEIAPDKKKQFLLLKKLMDRPDVDELIEATDAGREGELIFRLVYTEAGCTKPFKRLWISSMEDEAIRNGFRNLKDSREYDALYASALARSKADWIVGINDTRLFSSLYHHKLTVGRVQSPTLAMLAKRAEDIGSFVSEKYRNVDLDLGDFAVSKQKISDPAEAEKIRSACDGQTAEITQVEREEKAVNPPHLYDLTTLQREANRYFGYTAKETLDLTQDLYEKKLVTYPRTDSQYLTEEMDGTAKRLIGLIPGVFPFASGISYDPDVKRLINNSKVSDHHAIIPTAEIEKQDLTALPKKEYNLLCLIAMRLLSASSAPEILSVLKITAECAGTKFDASGKSIVSPGFKAVEAAFRQSLKTDPADDPCDDCELPDVEEGAFFKASASVSEHATTPPKQYTEDTLLSSMETAGNGEFEKDTEKKGLGTPATRASMIEKLVSCKYAERKGKAILITKDGSALIRVLPEKVKSPVLTAEWENTLTEIARGNGNADAFLKDIVQMTADLIHSTESPVAGVAFSEPDRKRKEEIGICPRCGAPVYEGEKNFYCSNRDCRFVIWKESRYLDSMRAKIGKETARELLQKGRAAMHGLYSAKKGRSFDAALLMKDDGERVNYTLEFPKERR